MTEDLVKLGVVEYLMENADDSVLTLFGNILSDGDSMLNIAPYLLLNQTSFLPLFLQLQPTETHQWVLSNIVSLRVLSNF
jgi:hypothetical protein